MTKRAFTTSILLVAGILLLINVLADQFFARLDFTADKRYTLSEATTNILENLRDPITVTGYFSEDLPPDIARTQREFRELLTEYAAVSDGMVVYEFKNPNEDQEIEMEAMQNGISPVLIDVRERDQMTQKRAFLGAIVRMAESREVIPFLQPGAAMEYSLSTAIKKLSIDAKPSIAWIQGHGEPPVGQVPEVSTALDVLYSLVPFSLADTVGATIPPYFKTAVIMAPTDTIPPLHLAQFDELLARGGRLLVAFDRVTGDFQSAQGRIVHTGLSAWLRNKGLEIEDSFVIDVSCGSVGVQQQAGNLRFTSNVQFPYLPIISTFPEHPIVDGLEAVLMQFASPLTFVGDTTITYTPLAQTSDRSGAERPPLFFDINREWEEIDFPRSNLTVGAVLEGPLSGSQESKMVVITDGQFALGGGRQTGSVQPDNVSLMVNAVDWLSDDTGLIDLRTKGVSARPLDPLEDGTKTLLKYLNFLAPLLLIIGYGVFRAQRRRARRAARKVAEE